MKAGTGIAAVAVLLSSSLESACAFSLIASPQVPCSNRGGYVAKGGRGDLNKPISRDTGAPACLCRGLTTTRMAGMDKAAELDLTTSPPRKIGLFIEPSPFTHISGYSNRFREMLKYLRKANDKVEIVTTDDHDNAPTEFSGYPIDTTVGFRFHLYNHIVLTFDHELRGWNMIERLKPDLIHVTSPGFIVFAALLYARLARIPLVFSYHTHLPLYAKSYLSWVPYIDTLCFHSLNFVHNRADLTLVTSPQMQEELRAKGMERVDVWRKGIDTERFNPSFKSAEMRHLLSDGHPEDPLLIYVGRLGSEKRLKDIKGVLERLPNVRMAFVGTGPDEGSLKDHFKGTRTKFTGIMTGEKLSQAFASADVFLMPSDSETLGFVVLESMASGVPVVGANAGGIPDLIQDGETGYLVPPGDSAAMAEKVKILLSDKSKYSTMAIMGRKETEKWSWEAATAYLRNVQYRKAMINFKYRALNGWGLPHTRTKWRAMVNAVRGVMGKLKLYTSSESANAALGLSLVPNGSKSGTNEVVQMEELTPQLGA